jgi:hypothetical protein
MAIKSSLRIIAKRIAQAVQLALSNHKLSTDHYLLLGTYDERSERISLTLGVDQLVDEGRVYAEILDELRQEFREWPNFTMHIGLVIRQVSKLDEVYYDDSLGSLNGDEEFDLTDMLQRA